MTSTVMCNCGLWACSNSVVVCKRTETNQNRECQYQQSNISVCSVCAFVCAGVCLPDLCVASSRCCCPALRSPPDWSDSQPSAAAHWPQPQCSGLPLAPTKQAHSTTPLSLPTVLHHDTSSTNMFSVPRGNLPMSCNWQGLSTSQHKLMCTLNKLEIPSSDY